MNSGQRTAVSLMVTAALFAGFIFSVYSSLFDKIETKFYEPERISAERDNISKASDFCNSYIQNLLQKATAFSENEVVQSYLSQTPTESEVTERVRLSGELFVSLPALDGLRLLDKNARNLHYSSYSEDIVKQSGTTRVYKNYPDIEKITGEAPFSLVAVDEKNSVSKVTFNSIKNQINISVPVFDKYNVFRGTFVFYMKTVDLERELVKGGYVSLGDSVSLFVNEKGVYGGFVAGIPNIGRSLFEKPVLDSWTMKSSGPEKVVESEENTKWVLLSDYSSPYAVFAEVYTSDYFELPDAARILILVCIFITLFLVVFLLFSFKIDDMVVIRSRIRKIQFAFISEYLDNKESVDWNQVSRQIEGRKQDLFADVKKSLGRKGKKHEAQVDVLLNKSWDEILSAIGTKQHFENQIENHSSAELKKILEEVLSSSELKVKAVENKSEKNVSAVIPETVDTSMAVEEIEPVEELSEVEEVEEVEPVEELSEVEEVEEVEPVEELSEVEEIEEVEPVEELGEAEEVEEVEPVEELSEVEEIEEVEPVEELSEVDETENSIEILDSEEEKGDSEEEVLELLEEEEPTEDVELVEEPVEEEVLEIARKLESPEEQIAESDRTFHTAGDDIFATVDNVFAEELRFGEEYIDRVKFSYDSEVEQNITFTIFDPEFGENEELIPVEENNSFSMTGFGLNSDYVSDLEEEQDTIIEKNGIYSISETVQVPFTGLDKEFKKLVDAVLR